MRSDIAKVMTERGHSRGARSAKAREYGTIHTFQDVNEFDYEGWGVCREIVEETEYDGMTHLPTSRKQEGYLKKIGYKGGSFATCRPITRWLGTQVGQYWPKIYSELCHSLRNGPWVVEQVLRYLGIHEDCYHGADGKVWANTDCGPRPVGGNPYYRSPVFYVEPVTLVLRRAVREKEVKPAPRQKDTDRVEIRPGIWRVNCNGLWFEGVYEKTTRLVDLKATAAQAGGPGHSKYFRRSPVYRGVEWPNYMDRSWDLEYWRFIRVKSCSKEEIREGKKRIGDKNARA